MEIGHKTKRFSYQLDEFSSFFVEQAQPWRVLLQLDDDVLTNLTGVPRRLLEDMLHAYQEDVNEMLRRFQEFAEDEDAAGEMEMVIFD